MRKNQKLIVRILAIFLAFLMLLGIMGSLLSIF